MEGERQINPKRVIGLQVCPATNNHHRVSQGPGPCILSYFNIITVDIYLLLPRVTLCAARARGGGGVQGSDSMFGLLGGGLPRSGPAALLAVRSPHTHTQKMLAKLKPLGMFLGALLKHIWYTKRERLWYVTCRLRFPLM